jgi:hypothetical protein
MFELDFCSKFDSAVEKIFEKMFKMICEVSFSFVFQLRNSRLLHLECEEYVKAITVNTLYKT